MSVKKTTFVLLVTALTLTCCLAYASIPVEDLTAEKAGVPAEDFVSPELAVKSAVLQIAFTRPVEYLQLTTVVFPYVIETLGDFGYPVRYYEVNLFEGFHPDVGYEDIYDSFYVPPAEIAIDEENQTWGIPAEIKKSHTKFREEFERNGADCWLIPGNKREAGTVGAGTTIGGFSSTYPLARAVAKGVYAEAEPDSVTPLIQDRGEFFVFGYGDEVLIVQTAVWPPGETPRYFLDYGEFEAYIEPYIRKEPPPYSDNTFILRKWKFIDDFVPAGKVVEVNPLFLYGLYDGAIGSD